jgi:nicotinamide-nucleotide adenylyltransferase
MRGLLVGRYQPFHKGHLEVLLEAMETCDELIIGIGSAQESHTLENPFTAGERIEMIRLCLSKDKRARTIMVPIPDVNRFAIWVSHIESLVPPFKAVFTNNPLTKSLFEAKRYKVYQTKIYDRSVYSGTVIRDRMLNGGDWKELVPEKIVGFLSKLDGPSRIKAATSKEE